MTDTDLGGDVCKIEMGHAAAFVERATATIDALAEFFADQNRKDPCLADLDTAAVSGNTCTEFKGWGKCEESWLVQGGFCG